MPLKVVYSAMFKVLVSHTHWFSAVVLQMTVR